MSLKGNIQSLISFSKELRKLPKETAQRIATRAAPIISSLGRRTFDAGEDSYGTPWAPGHDGQKVTLRKTGALARFVYYVAIGSRLRVALGVPYAKYQIGKRPVYPRNKKPLPAEYAKALSDIAAQEIQSGLRGSK